MGARSVAGLRGMRLENLTFQFFAKLFLACFVPAYLVARKQAQRVFTAYRSRPSRNAEQATPRLPR